MSNEPPRRLMLYQQPVRGIRLDEVRFRGGRGQVPAMPCLALRIETDEGVDLNLILERYMCTIQLYDSAGAVRLPDSLFFQVQQVRCQLVPSMGDPNQIDPLFIFGEIVIRECGVFRLRVVLHEAGESRLSRRQSWTEITSIMTDPFDVVEYHQFPGGAVIWTPLSQHLRAHGIVLHFPPDNDSVNWDEEYPTINGV